MKHTNQKKILYLDCTSGISGDMFAAAMLDLGADREVLRRALDSIPVGGFRTEISRVKKQAIDCCDFKVILDAELDNRDDDMEYLFGHTHSHMHEDHAQSHHHHHDTDGNGSHHHADEGEHSGHSHEHGDHDHSHDHHGSHVHRSLRDVREILAVADMTGTARALADKIFVILAQAEAKAHGATEDTVHFHEVGAVDSIVDIITAAVCFDNLNVDGVYVSPLFEGSGTIRCAHGVLPIPVPAVANILAGSRLQISLHPDVHGEYITPTGAAIAAAIVTETTFPEQVQIISTGLGAGKRDYERANYLRAMLLRVPQEQKTAHSATEMIYKLETDIDDCSPEVLGYLLERLMEAGARDAHYLPVYMKKNRPGWQLQVICTEDKISDMEELIFTESTSIGVRRIQMERTALPREIREVETPYGTARVKVCTFQDAVRYYPEYESVAELAKKNQMPFTELFSLIRDLAQESSENDLTMI